MRQRLFFILFVAAIVLSATPARAQDDLASAAVRPDATGTPLTLQQAVTIALEKNPLRKAALADQKVAVADLRGARGALLPRLSFTETATRGNDPVYAFGTRLRQGRFTTDDFAL